MMCVQCPNWDSAFENAGGIHANMVTGTVRWWHGHNSNRFSWCDARFYNEYPADLIDDHSVARNI